jgi:hypothetical protein
MRSGRTVVDLNDEVYLKGECLMPREDGYKNLSPWKAGESGNPSGRKTGLVTLLKEALETAKTDGGETLAEQLADSIIMHAIKGNGAYLNAVLDRTEGKVGAKSAQEQAAAHMTRCIIYLPCKDNAEHTATHFQGRDGKYHRIIDGGVDDDIEGTYEVGDDGRNPGLFPEIEAAIREATDGTAAQGS